MKYFLKHTPTLALLACLGIFACSPKPKPIDFGSVNCVYCKMTVVDHQHAAQLVSDKGKNFYFDAIECMLDYLKEAEEAQWAYILVSDYANPNQMVDATAAVYLISKAIPSPMGAYLSAFGQGADAAKTKALKGGDLYDWSQIITNSEISLSYYK